MMLARVSGAVGLLPARGRPLRCVLTAAVGRPSTLRRSGRLHHRFTAGVAALGGTLKLIADFGDEQLKVA